VKFRKPAKTEEACLVFEGEIFHYRGQCSISTYGVRVYIYIYIYMRTQQKCESKISAIRLFQICYDGLNLSQKIQPDSRLLYMSENPGKLSTSVTLLRPSESIIGLFFCVFFLLLPLFPYSPASTVKVKNVWSHTSTPSVRLHSVYRHSCTLHSVYRHSCTFTALKLEPHADFFVRTLRYFNNDSAPTF